MRVAQILYSGLGGHGTVALSLAKGDRFRKHDHTLVFYGIEPLEPSYAAACDRLGARRAFVQKEQGLDIQSWIAVARTLQGIAPNVVILHSVNLVAPVAVWSRAHGVPVIAVEHLSNAVKIGKDWAFTAGALLASDYVVYLTELYRGEVLARYPRLARGQRIRVIGNGVDLAAFAGCASRRPVDGVFRIGMHSRFAPPKDHRTLIEAFCVFRRKKPELECEMVLVGAGEALPAARECARQAGLGERLCSFPGAVAESDIPAFLSTLDVWCQSTKGETMSTAIMEAMAAGLPVVASNVPGIREMIGHGAYGLLVDPGSPAAWADALMQLADGPRLRGRLGARAAVRAASWSNIEMFQRYDALIGEVTRTA